MNTASLELCKELFELSGWGLDGDFRESMFWWFDNGGDWKAQYLHESTVGRIQHPAYDLGYLLRKLPTDQVKEHLHYSLNLLYANSYSHWVCGYGGTRPIKGLTREYSVNPENATAKLAIELIKQGVINP